MLAKLIKYDLKFIYKTLIIFIGLLVISAILLNVTSYDVEYTYENGMQVSGIIYPPVILQILHTIFFNCVIAFSISLILNSLMRIWYRFKNNFYHDEAYLTHTLPIPRNTLWLAKFLSTIIVLFSVILTFAATFALLSLTSGGNRLLSGLGLNSLFSSTENGQVLYTLLILVAFAELLFIALCGMSAVILSHRSSKPSGLRTVLFGFALYLISCLLLLGVIYLWSLFDHDISYLYSSTLGSATATSIFTSSFIIKILLGVTIYYTAAISALYLLDQKLLKKGINLD